MKTIDLRSEQHSLSEVLTLAKSEAVLIRSPGGEDFLLEHADTFDKEIAKTNPADNRLDDAAFWQGDCELRLGHTDVARRHFHRVETSVCATFFPPVSNPQLIPYHTVVERDLLLEESAHEGVSES